MIRHTLAMAILATSAQADAAREWGNSAARLMDAEPPAVAKIIYSNGYGPAQNVESFDLDGVRIVITAGHGMAPDRFDVTPPEGFIAVPQTGFVPEYGSATILIFSMEGVGA